MSFHSALVNKIRLKKLIKEITEDQSPNTYRNRIRRGLLKGTTRKYGKLRPKNEPFPYTISFYTKEVNAIDLDDVKCFANADNIPDSMKYNHETDYYHITPVVYQAGYGYLGYSDRVFDNSNLYSNINNFFEMYYHKVYPMPASAMHVALGSCRYSFKLGRKKNVTIIDKPSHYSMRPANIMFVNRMKDFVRSHDFEYIPNTESRRGVKGSKECKKITWLSYNRYHVHDVINGCEELYFLYLVAFIEGAVRVLLDNINIYQYMESKMRNDNMSSGDVMTQCLRYLSLNVYRESCENLLQLNSYIKYCEQYI